MLLLTDKDFGATAETARSGEPGIVGSAVGAPGDLLFDMVGSASRVQKGEIIVTAGTQDGGCARSSRPTSRSGA